MHVESGPSGGSGRLLLLEQDGRVKIVRPAGVLQIAFTDGNGWASRHLTYGPDDARRSVLARSQLYLAR